MNADLFEQPEDWGHEDCSVCDTARQEYAQREQANEELSFLICDALREWLSLGGKTKSIEFIAAQCGVNYQDVIG